MASRFIQLSDKQIRERAKLVLPFSNTDSEYQQFVDTTSSIAVQAGLKMCVAHWPEEDVTAVIPFDASRKQPSNNDIVRSFRAAKAIPSGAAGTVCLDD